MAGGQRRGGDKLQLETADVERDRSLDPVGPGPFLIGRESTTLRTLAVAQHEVECPQGLVPSWL